MKTKIRKYLLMLLAFAVTAIIKSEVSASAEAVLDHLSSVVGLEWMALLVYSLGDALPEFFSSLKETPKKLIIHRGLFG